MRIRPRVSDRRVRYGVRHRRATLSELARFQRWRHRGRRPSMSTIEHSAPLGATTYTPEQEELTLSVVIPCLNEEENITQVVSSAREVMEREGIVGEVIVADNDSDDRSAQLAADAGARDVHAPRRGHGGAAMAGSAPARARRTDMGGARRPPRLARSPFGAARGRYIVMGDADLTYDFRDIPRFLEQLEQGADLVMGDRMDNIQPGAMPWLHRYVGNPVLSWVLNLFFKTGIRDAHCGMRGLRRDILPQLHLRTPGMESASEMVIRASKEGLDIREFPIHYHPRGGESKLSSFRDGWRHLRFLLVHSPTHLFLVPGIALLLFGALITLTVLAHLDVFGRNWDLHAMVAGSLLLVVGTQVVALGLCAHAYGTYFMGERDPWFDRMRARFRLEHGLVLGGLVMLVGLIIAAAIVASWIHRGFGQLSEERLAVFAAGLIIIGVQIFFSSFLLSILGLRRRG